MSFEFEYTSGTPAGPLDEETLEEIWDHLELDYTPAIKSPVFNSRIISLFEKVNGIADPERIKEVKLLEKLR